MPQLPKPRRGEPIRVNHREVQFSLYPRDASPTHRRPIQHTIFSKNPWDLMLDHVGEDDTPKSIEARSYLNQGKDLFESATRAEAGAAKPVQLYYAFLNLIKAYIRNVDESVSLLNVQHGLGDIHSDAGGVLDDLGVKYFRTRNVARVQALDAFLKTAKLPRITHEGFFSIEDLLPQILPGHRIWAYNAEDRERFIALHNIAFVENKNDKKCWLKIFLYADDVSRLGYTQNTIIEKSGLKQNFKKVKCEQKSEGRKLLSFESKLTVDYSRHATDKLEELVKTIQPFLWSTVGTSPPYRRYYLYINPTAAREEVVTQLASIYMLTFLLGSITRYRPNDYGEILKSKHGARIRDFLDSQPNQFLFLISSLFIAREISSPSIV